MKEQTGMMTEQCVTCRKEVSSKEKAILCEMCESWEHVACIRASERPSEALYEAMVSCRSKAVVFTFMSCRKRGSIVKRIMQHELESVHADEERSAHLLEQKGETVARLEAELEKIRIERDDLYKGLFSQATVTVKEPVKLTEGIPLKERDAVVTTMSKADSEEKSAKMKPPVLVSHYRLIDPLRMWNPVEIAANLDD